ncbi:hypothetical protein [Enterobacter sp. Bisph1]|uniref:hypothetical protein n=1 Tax=Enterobacter sp. Bisph1 TaxID=1274399 RepID=UPI00057BE3F2|nr:hypothetical protein [Enterobacter sp. Bisph1]
MFFKPTINPKKQGISAAIEMKENTEEISAKTVNKLLQILYDDLKNANNISYDKNTLKYTNAPAHHVTRDLIRLFIAVAAERNARNRMVAADRAYYYSRNLYIGVVERLPGFQTCCLLVEKMLTKYLFIYELNRAKEILNQSRFLQSDPRRLEVLNFILKAEIIVQQKNETITNNTMMKMYHMGLIRNTNLPAFKTSVKEFIEVIVLPKKVKLKLYSPKIIVKRHVKHFRPYSTDQLKANIEALLVDLGAFDSLYKEMELLDKLMELCRDDEENYPTGKKITLSYTGKPGHLNWWTKEECLEHKFPLINPIEREIPNEETYRLEANQLQKRYAKQQQPMPAGEESLA